MTNNIKVQARENLSIIADQFALFGQVQSVQPFGSGNINDTFLVTQNSLNKKNFVLQRINTQVFHQPQFVMRNMRIFTEHVNQRLKKMSLNRRWEVPEVLLTKDGQDHYCDTNGSFWRAISFIEASESFDTMHSGEQAREIGYALGMFHNLISDLSPQKLADTLEGFHITPLYLNHYNEVLATATPRQSPEVNYCLDFVEKHYSLAPILENAKASGQLPLRLMHGDPKINNVMFDTSTKKAVSVIDLDTVKPGLVHYDIGDCLRSGCNPAGEETENWQSITFDTDICKEILQGYLSVAKEFLTENDYIYMYDAIRLIAFELGLRFFADYLAGNVYFKVKYPEHNLARALVQFKLTESIEAQQATIQKIIKDIK